MTDLTKYPPLENVTAELVNTNAAAHYTGYKPKTLRAWASQGGPLVPDVRNGRNLYRVAKIRQFVKAVPV